MLNYYKIIYAEKLSKETIKIILFYATKEPVYIYHGYKGFINTIQFSPNGKLFATGSGHWSGGQLQDNCVRVFSIKNGLQEKYPKKGNMEGHVNDVAWSRDAKTIAIASNDPYKMSFPLHLWDRDTNQVRLCKDGHVSVIKSVDFSRDSQYVASYGDDVLVCIWNAKTTQLVAKCSKYCSTSLKKYVKFSPFTYKLAWNVNKQIMIYDFSPKDAYERNYLEISDNIETLNNHVSNILNFSWYPTKKFQVLASTSWGRITLQNAETKVCENINFYGKDKSTPKYIEWSPDGNYLATASDKTVSLIDVGKSRIVKNRYYASTITDIDWSSSGLILSSGGSALFWDPRIGNNLSGCDSLKSILTGSPCFLNEKKKS